MQIFEKICDIIRGQLCLDDDFVFTDGTTLTDVGADSLDLVEIIMCIEDAFDITIPDGEESKLHTVGDAVRYVETLLQ